MLRYIEVVLCASVCVNVFDSERYG